VLSERIELRDDLMSRWRWSDSEGRNSSRFGVWETTLTLAYIRVMDVFNIFLENQGTMTTSGLITHV
jgi:hypothetical protein